MSVLVLLVLALAAFVAAAFLARRSSPWGALVAGGLALVTLVQLLAALPGGVG